MYSFIVYFVQQTTFQMYKSIHFLDEIEADYLQSVNEFVREWESQSTTMEVFTSGSTGRPKSVLLNKIDMEKSARATGKFFGFKEGQSLLLNLSPNYIAGKLMIVRALVHQMNIVAAPLSANPLLALKSYSDKIHFAAFVPSQVKAILQDEISRKIYSTLEKVIIGGAAVNSDLEAKICQHHKATYATFGMTETITHFALRQLGDPVKLYQCLEGTTVGVDAESRLIVHSPLVEEALQTNDVIELVDDTSFVWKGRADYVINSGGVKVHPEEVESEIRDLIPNQRFYISAASDDQFGEVVALVLEGEEFDEGAFFEALKLKKLKKYHAPRRLILVREFEETPTGKIIRKKF